MKIVNAKHEILGVGLIDGRSLLQQIELVGRTCYKSESKITEESSEQFVRMLIQRGHEAMIEHNSISVRFTCDRGVSHELVRHRIASFGQESTRYCNYSKSKFGNEITVIKPLFFEEDSDKFFYWKQSMVIAETQYFQLLNTGASPQEARSVLPNSLKTEIVMSMNLREWRHFFSLRADTPAHPQMREIVCPLLKEMNFLIPVVFEDLVHLSNK